MRCPLCQAQPGERPMRPIYRREATPVLNNVIHPTRLKALAAASGALEVVACTRCGFVFNRAFAPQGIRYDAAYDSNRRCSAVYCLHQDTVAQRLAADLDAGMRILEVGCGEGFLLEAIARISGCQVTGIDPRCAGRAQRHEQLRLLSSMAELAPGEKFTLIIFQHVLEHLPSFLASLESLLHRHGHPGTRVYLEVPALEWILAQGNFFDFTYEHVNYFSEATLKASAASLGLVIEALERVYQEQYLCLLGRIDGGEKVAPPAFTGDFDLTELARKRCNLTAFVRRAERIVVWGASGKGTICLCDLWDELEGSRLRAVDINPHKQGRFLPLTGVAIISPEQLAGLEPFKLLIMNPIYADEIQARMRALNIRLPKESRYIC